MPVSNADKKETACFTFCFKNSSFKENLKFTVAHFLNLKLKTL